MKKLIIILSLLTSPILLACTEDGQTGFMPENDMSIPVDSVMGNSMTEKRFNQIIDKIADVYSPIIAKKWKKLVVKRKWKDATVNASAQQVGPWWIVNMYGGLARHPAVTDDGFALVVCHELGHHLGGAPKVKMIVNTWATNEGQADYFGTLKCFKRVFRNDDNIGIISTMNVPSYVTEKCEESYANASELALCQRTAMASMSLATLLGGGNRRLDFKTPDPTVVTRTDDRHPQAQCRLDTYFQGALCDKDYRDNVSDKDPNVGVCNRKDGDQLGLRPLCWYRPN